MKRNGFYRLLATLMVAFVAACGSGEGPDSAGVGVASLTEKATTPTSGGVANAQPVFRFAKISSGAYFYTGSLAERDLILRTYPDFRCEGVAFYRTSDDSGTPVFRFANLSTGGYFYTASVAERDFVLQTRSDLRYEGSTFSVSGAMTGAQPVFRLANLRNGAYLYTTNPLELQAAIRLGYWRSEGEGFAGTPQPADLSVPSDGWCNGSDPTNTGTELALMIDSLGRAVPEGDFGGGDGGASGADGSAGDGAPIANRPVVLTDLAGRTARTTTDALGYYRLNIKGFTPPFVVKVTREDGTEWYAPSVTPVKTRGFVTINITGLTDKVGGYVADATNTAGGAARVTPALLATNAAALQAAKNKLKAGLTSPLTYVGLNPTTFDPVTTPYKAVKTDNYDQLLDRLSMAKVPTTGGTTVVGTFAGVKESFVNGAADSATFSAVFGVAVDGAGNVYVADTGNNVIRKITPFGVVSTLAGSGVAGFINGVGTNARFNRPDGIAVDSSGNVFVADANNHAIRKIAPGGVVTTVAGNGTFGSANGVGTAASFNGPAGLAFDSGGNLFVGDFGNNMIRKITPAGVVTTLAGSGSPVFTDGVGARATFNGPSGVAVDARGNVYVADQNNNAIRKVSEAGAVNTVLTVGYPFGVAVDSSGNLFASDNARNLILKLTPDGTGTIFAGSGIEGSVDGGGQEARFNQPTGIAVDPSGNVFVADNDNHSIRKITPAALVTTLAGFAPYGYRDGTGTTVAFNTPLGAAVDATGNVYVADKSNHVIRKITPSGVVSTLAGTGSSGLADGAGTGARFNSPFDVAVDGAGNVYVADTGNAVIRKITPFGVVSTLGGFYESHSFNPIFSPVGVAVDDAGNVYVSDQGRNSIHKITPAGVFSTLAGGGSPGLADGVGVEARFKGLGGIVVDSAGNVFVADSGNHAIRRVTPSGVVSTLAGNGRPGSLDGIGAAARFNSPTRVAFNSVGNLYVADFGNSAVRRITPSGVVTTIAGGSLGYANGAGPAASFNGPQGITVDRSGNVFVSDTDNHAIRVILP